MIWPGLLSATVCRSDSDASVGVVLVVAAPPDALLGLVATERRAVQPLEHAPDAVQPAPVRRVGVVDDPILRREPPQPGRLSSVRRPVRSHGRSDLPRPASPCA